MEPRAVSATLIWNPSRLHLLLIALQDLVAHLRPDLAVQLEKARQQPAFRHIAGPRQVDDELADRARTWARRQYDHPVREGDGLLQVVRNEDHRLAIGFPQLEQLVLHQ